MSKDPIVYRISLNSMTSTSPRSVSLSSGITGRATKERMANGAAELRGDYDGQPFSDIEEGGDVIMVARLRSPEQR